MLRVEGRQESGEEAFSGDGACRNGQVARDGRTKAAEISSSLFVEVEDLASAFIEPLTRFGEGNSSDPTVEQ
jgi:hypothetical protein